LKEVFSFAEASELVGEDAPEDGLLFLLFLLSFLEDRLIPARAIPSFCIVLLVRSCIHDFEYRCMSLMGGAVVVPTQVEKVG
jgi:hypothetical protein